MYVARDIFSLFLLHLCRKLQRRAPFWGQSGRKSFTTKTFPLPYSATAPLFPTSDDLHVQSSRCFFTAVLSTKSEDFARLDRKTFVTLARTVHICILKGREMSAMVLGSKYPSLWAMAWTRPIYSGNP